MQYRKNLSFLLLAVREQVRARFRPTLRRFGLTEQQWRILRALDEGKVRGIVDLADACLILRPSIVGIISRMEELDLVKRSPVARDKRRSNIELTAHGALLVRRIFPIFDRIYKAMEAELGTAKLNELYRILEFAHERLSPATSEAEAGDE